MSYYFKQPASQTVFSVETVSGDGAGKDAISLETRVSLLDSSGGTSDLTLAAGHVGQEKVIIMTVQGNTATLEDATGDVVFAGTAVNSISFDAVGEAVTLVYTAVGWAVTGSGGGVTIA